jgi:pimeloyl-ACP methyl ester carboxylesterase
MGCVSSASTPLHPDELRIDHWSGIDCPVLLLSGDRDQFAGLELLKQSVQRLAKAELHVYPGLGHGLLAVAQDVARRIAAFAEHV